jgi:hypothetical protein
MFLIVGLLVLTTVSLKQVHLPIVAPTEPDAQIAAPDFGKLPLSFVPNRGQINTEDVRFQAHALGGTIYFAPQEIVLALPTEQHHLQPGNNQVISDSAQHLSSENSKPSMLRMRFQDANLAPEVVGSDQLPGIVNYYIGSDPDKWRTNLPRYAGITYKQIYPGIDLHYEGTNSHLKGTYIVAPGANPGLIRWKYEGASSVRIHETTGDLLIAIEPQEMEAAVTESAPIVWQEIHNQQVPVDARYVISDNGVITFALGSYDPAYPLQIDPTLIYGTILGERGAGCFGTIDNCGGDIAVDGEGSAYITGFVSNSDNNSEDIFVSKLTPDGTSLVYDTYIGSSRQDRGYSIAIDNAGSAYITGMTTSEDFPGAGNRGRTETDAVVVKLSPSGTRVYSRYLGGSGFDRGFGIAVDSATNAYVVGQTDSTDFPKRDAVQEQFGGGGADAFFVKLEPDGSDVDVSTYLGGRGDDRAFAVAVDSEGSASITGETSSGNFPLRTAWQTERAGDEADVFITRFTATGRLTLSTYLGGNGRDVGYDIALDATGAAYLTGSTASDDFPFANNTRRGAGNDSDIFIARVRSDNSGLSYSTYLGGDNLDYGYSIAVDPSDNAYVTGETLTANPHTFVLKLSPDGSRLLDEYRLDGSASESGYGIAVDAVGNAYVTGYTASSDFLNRGQLGTFVTKISATAPGDLVADELEVTQAIQDLNNTVRLVAGKRTFVRFHVHSTTGSHHAYAELEVRRGDDKVRLRPINPSQHIGVIPKPDRSVLNDAFLFELPSNYTNGYVVLRAEVNPATNWGTRIPEPDYFNNASNFLSISFERVPPVEIKLYRVGLGSNSNRVYPNQYHLDKIVDWLRSAYPLSTLNVKYRTMDYRGRRRVPKCYQVNNQLTSLRQLEGLLFSDIRYYGVIDDEGRGRRGACASGVVASGWAGSDSEKWDYDGTYADWLAGHELGHTYGRDHTVCRGDEAKKENGGADPNYPSTHVQGRISPVLDGNGAIYGFNIGTTDIYTPDWKDVMTYCPNRWISDYTYHKLMDYFQDNLGDAAASTRVLQTTQHRTDRLLVFGSIDLLNHEVELQPLFVLSDAVEQQERVPGDYAIVLRDTNGNRLANYPFTPREVTDVTVLQIAEMVPYVAGTTTVDIEGPGGRWMARVHAGVAPPSVNVTAPNGGETLSQDSVQVTWTSNDPDGDVLVFNVEYSPDNGATWEMVAQNVTDNQVEIDAINIIASEQARFRVWATDGIHTASDETDASFRVPNHVPTVEIREPTGDLTVVAGETLGLVGYTYDIDSGTMDANQLTWISSIDGVFGNGDQWSVADLSVGTHIITFRADDGDGEVVSDSIKVTVVADPTLAPPVSDKLLAGPELLSLDTILGQTSARLSIDNQNSGNSITWNATSAVSWLTLSATTGTTPGAVTVSVDEENMPRGTTTTTVTLTSPAAPGEEQTIRVVARRAGYRLFLPIIAQEDGSALTSTPPAPDLVGSLSLSPDKRVFAAGEQVQITAVITNQGTMVTEPSFWADLFITPSAPPTVANMIWSKACKIDPCLGITWEVNASLAPGESIVLTSTPDSFAEGHTVWPGWFTNGTKDLYLYVDSYNLAAPDGAVEESDETNNRAALILDEEVQGINPASVTLSQPNDLPVRPAPGRQ